MKISMQMTLDGLLRALRWQAHNIAEDVAMRRGTARRTSGKAPRRPEHRPAMRDSDDDRARR